MSRPDARKWSWKNSSVPSPRSLALRCRDPPRLELDRRRSQAEDRKCKGYAFVCTGAHIMPQLAEFLWQRAVPTRQSERVLKIHPAGFETLRFQ